MKRRTHPAQQWRDAACASTEIDDNLLRLAAMAGHMQVDPIAARRAALLDLLLDGRPHLREEIWERVAAGLGQSRTACWGRAAQDALQRDMRALRAGGLRIAYSRRTGASGYYLQHPPLTRHPGRGDDEGAEPTVNWLHVESLRALSPAEKNRMAFAAAGNALRFQQQRLRQSHPDWPPDQLAAEAAQRLFRLPRRPAEALTIAAYDQPAAFAALIDILERLSLRYAIWGGMGAVAHGEPRFTPDIDFLIDPGGASLAEAVPLLEDAGFKVVAGDDCAPAGRALGVLHKRCHIRGDFHIAYNPTLQGMLDKRIYLPFDHSRRAPYLSPQDLIQSKLRVYAAFAAGERSPLREIRRHAGDIAAVIRIHADRLDPAALDLAAVDHGLLGLWRSLWERNCP